MAAQRLSETDITKIIPFLKARKGGGTIDICKVTDPGKDSPVNILEGAKILSVQFFDGTGNSVISSTVDDQIALIEVHTQYGVAVWVRNGNESLLTQRWNENLRIREVESF